MTKVRIQFIAKESTNHACIEAATILACSLSHQGYACERSNNQLTLMVPDLGSNQPSHLYLLLEEQLLSQKELLAQFDGKSGVVVCSARPARTLHYELGQSPVAMATVDASGIGDDEGADPIVALLGGAARVLSFIDPELLGTAIWTSYDRQLPYTARAAVRAFDLGYAQTQHLHL